MAAAAAREIVLERNVEHPVHAFDAPVTARPGGEPLDWLARNPVDPIPLEQLVRSDSLSVSRFLHLLSNEVGVPFRRFKILNRLRAACGMVLGGAVQSDRCPIAAGFSDSAHFPGCIVTPSE